jgi:excinuclease ABC subunit A
MTQRQVVVEGAREHNLKGIDVAFPRDALVTFSGVSGSGKSSLAYHTIYQEGQRRFLESLSSYARQFLGRMEKPKVERIEGLSPTVSIDQKSVGHSPRSTVGTLTEVWDFLRLWYARLGEPACPVCQARIETWSVDRIAEAVGEEFRDRQALVLAPVVRERKGEYRAELADWRGRGFVRARIDGELRRLDEDVQLQRYQMHTIELVVDRLRIEAGSASRVREAVEQAVQLSSGIVAILAERDYRLFSTSRSCPAGHGALPELEPRLFSFNSPVGACPDCEGLGEQHSFREDLLVRDANLPLAAGALHVFNDEGRLVYSHLTLEHLAKVGERLGFSVATPWRKLGAKQRRLILHGAGEERFEFRWQRKARSYTAEGVQQTRWRGVLGHLAEVYGPATARHLDRFRAATVCPACAGARLNAVARAVTFQGEPLHAIAGKTLSEAAQWLAAVRLCGNAARIGEDIRREIAQRLRFLTEVGLGYLTLDRRANTLSGGESQRIRLAAQVGAGLRGILYVLDEPSIGLHPRDQDRLLGTLRALRDRGNTVCVVEHDEATIRGSDWVVDVGPGAGTHGGELVASGPPPVVAGEPRSLTGAYLRGELRIKKPEQRRNEDRGALVVRGAAHHNLKNVTVAFPLGRLIAVTGVSGSGKSTLVDHVLKRALRRALHGAQDVPGTHAGIDGLERVDKVVEIDQEPIGRTPRSNPATYTGLWDHVRDLYAELPESRLRAYPKGRFSFNVAGGRCEACDGAGVMTLEMQFLAPVEVVCDVCQGRRFNAETLEVQFKGRNVEQVLAMTVEEAHGFFAALGKIARPLRALLEVGLGYVTLGQPSTTLSGGEAQRVKLATELQRPATGRTIYLLDEPTTGLHFADVDRLVACLQRLVDAGNTVVVIEHHLDVVQQADWVIDLGPEGGEGGGRVVAEGTPEQIALAPGSHTGVALRALQAPVPAAAAPAPDAGDGARAGVLAIRGATKNNLQNVDVDLPLERFTVVTGPSGSGKSSLAFDTLFNEGQRRFLESLSTYARRFLGRLDRAPVERIDGLGPAIAIDQKAAARSPRSTVATATEIHDYLRLLYARVGRPHCPDHGQELTVSSPSSIARDLIAEFRGQKGYVLAPFRIPADLLAERERLAQIVAGRRAAWRDAGFVRALVDGAEHRLDDELPSPKHADGLFLVVDRVTFSDRARLVDSVAQASEQGGGLVVARTAGGEQRSWSTDRSCPQCGFTVPKEPHPRWFSFNHHSGACATCGGLGSKTACDEKLLVNHPELPLFRGAIEHKGAAFTFLARAGGWFHDVARAVAREEGFDLERPFRELDRRAQKVLLRGLPPERKFEVTWRPKTGHYKKVRMQVPWKGLGTQVEDWFQSPTAEQSKETLRPVMRVQPCADCGGERLQRAQRHVRIGRYSLPQLLRLTVDEALGELDALALGRNEQRIAAEVRKEIHNRLSFLRSVGLGYLTLERSAATLSGGEAQRIRLATQLGNRLVGVLYVLDEPTVGLHPRDTERLLQTLLELRDLGNTVVAVEHDESVIRRADWVVDLGPGAGHQGGRVVAAGTPAKIEAGSSLTGQYLRRERRLPTPAKRRQARGTLPLRGVRVHNLKGIDVDFPLGVLTAVTGVSGSGKSSLVLDALLPMLEDGRARPPGLARFEVAVVDQSPIGTTPASNPATYCEIWTPIRALFAQAPQSRVKGFGPGRFSFNVEGGRCAACEGKGQIQVEMHFLADVWVTCETCRGRRFNLETLAVTWRGKTIADVLDLEAAQALQFFGNHSRIARPLQMLVDVGLGYLRLGQSATTLSGGEAQRIKLVGELARRSRVPTIFLLDEPTTGLHADDVHKLVLVLQCLVERGDTVIVIEHHLDVIRCADWVIELGPEAGDDGGRVVVCGPPERVAAEAASHTGRFLAPLLDVAPSRPRSRKKKARIAREAS